MEKFTDEQIIKALEEMAAFKSLNLGCRNVLHNAIYLINRPKAEIEELRKGFTADADYFASEYDTKIESEAIKEFAERLKDELGEDVIYEQYPFLGCAIDNLLKEMTERINEK